MADNSEEKPAHLRKLPIKSFDVAPGDVVGGMVFVMDKPLGIEEGMVGISVDSVPYRAFIAEQLMSLIKDTNENTELQARFNQKISEDQNFKSLIDSVKQHKDNLLAADTKQVDKLITAMMSDQKHVTKRHPPSWDEAKKVFTTFGELGTIKGLTTYKENKGLGGLLFEGYKTDCGVKPGSKFYVEIGKLMAKGDKAYMVKQDGELILGGTGPSLTKILKTTMGKTYLQPLMNPLVILATGGLSAVAFGIGAAAWKGYYLRNNNPVKANSDAIVETISTKMGKAKGFAAQEIDTIEGTYDKKDNKPKIATIVTWTPGCVDLGGRVTGDESNLGSVAVSYNDDGIRIKTDGKGNIFQGFEAKSETGAKLTDKNGQPVIEYFKIDQKNNNKKTACSEQDYHNAPYTVSDDKIYGMGESLASFIGSGDTDGIGSKGQNKAIVPLDKDKNYGSNYTHQFYGIDFGKAYNQDPSPIVGSLRDDFSFEKPSDATLKFSNYSMLYDNPLSDKMKGIYLLAALRGELTEPRKSQIANEYSATDPVFTAKLKAYPNPTPGINGDLTLIQAEIKNYERLANEAGKNKQKKAEYTSYADRLKTVERVAQQTDTQILKTFEERIKLNPSQIDVLDNIEKLTAKKASILSADGKVILNHIEVKRENRVAWQIAPGSDDKFRLYCEADKSEHAEILGKLSKYAENNPTIKDLIEKIKFNNGTNKIEATLTSQELTTLTQSLTEASVVKARKDDKQFTGAELYRSQDQKDAFHAALKQASAQKPEESQSNRLSNRLSNMLEVDNTASPRSSARLSQEADSLFTVVNNDRTVPLRRDSLGDSQRASIGPFSDDLSSPSSPPSSRDSSIFTGDVNRESLTPLRSGPPRTLAVVQDTSLKNVISYFKNEDSKTNHPNIKNIDALKGLPIPSGDDTHTPPKPILIKLAQPGSENSIDVTVKQALNGNQVQYFAPKNLPKDDFRFIAAEICKLAVLSSKPGAKFDFSNAPPQKQEILKEEFKRAVDTAVLKGKFTKDEAPSLKEPSGAPSITSSEKPKTDRHSLK